MGMNVTLSVVVGIRIQREELEEHISHPAMVDGMENDLVAFYGGEYVRKTVVLGKKVYSYTEGEEANVSMDLLSAYAKNREEVREEIEEEFGFEDRELSTHLVGGVR